MARFLTEHSSYLSERQTATFQPSGLAPESTTARSVCAESHVSDPANHVDTGSEVNDLSDLLYDQQVTSEGLVNHAIDWLLE